MRKKFLIVVFANVLLVSNFIGISNYNFIKNNNETIKRKIDKKLYANNKNVSFEYEFDVDNKYVGSNDKFENKNVCDENIDVERKYFNEKGEVFTIKNEIINDNANVSPVYTDANENNDSFAEASIVYTAGQDNGHYGNYVSWWATISQKTSGWWLWEKKYVDKDFYAFDVTVTGTLEVGLKNIPADCDYDLRIYKLDNTINTDCNNLDFDKSECRISMHNGNEDEYIKITDATPGTYYAVVYAFLDKTWNNDEPYQIWFQQTQNTSKSNSYYNIDSGRSNNDLGAIWTSDYKPLGITPTTLTNSNAKVYFNNYDKYPFIRNLSNRYRNEDLMYAKLYVWDVATRAAIYEVLNRILSIVNSYNQWEDNQQNKFNIVVNSASVGLSIAGYIIAWISMNDLALAVAATISSLGLAVASASLVISLAVFVATFTMKSPFDITKANLREYLINAKAGFEVGRGSNNQQVVTLKFRYHFGNDNGNYFDYSPIYRNDDKNLYNDTSINYIDPNSCINGSVIGFKTIDDIQGYLK